MEEYLTVKQVAEMFGVTPYAVSDWVRKGKVTHFRTPGGHVRFRRSDVDGILQQVEAS